MRSTHTQIDNRSRMNNSFPTDGHSATLTENSSNIFLITKQNKAGSRMTAVIQVTIVFEAIHTRT